MGVTLNHQRGCWTPNRSWSAGVARPAVSVWVNEREAVKRHLVVDILGLLGVVVVVFALVQDRHGGKAVLDRLTGRFSQLIRNRRLGRDGERLTGNSETMFKIVLIW